MEGVGAEMTSDARPATRLTNYVRYAAAKLMRNRQDRLLWVLLQLEREGRGSLKGNTVKVSHNSIF